MSRWRPAPECIYVIADIHGYNNCLSQVLNRILPLRPNDQVIFLGDYVDRGPDSKGVLDSIIKLKKQYGEQVTCLMGNHEWLFLVGIGVLPAPVVGPRMPSALETWMAHGGPQTIKSYCMAADISEWQSLPFHRMLDIVPEEHIDFLLDAHKAYEYKDYIFVHAGCDPGHPLDEQPDEIFLWDRSLYRMALQCINDGVDIPWEKIVVTGHNYDGPVITDKFMMLDCSGSRRLLVAELNSMEGFYAFSGRSRMLRANLEETVTLSEKQKKRIG